MDILPQIIVSGSAAGGVYGLIALGFVLIYKATSIINLATGEFMTTRLMLLDEPSMGPAPMLVAEIFQIIRRINERAGVTILLVEQNARLALNVAGHGYVMENGRIVLDDSVEKLKENADVKEFYLGLTEVGKKKSYRDVKHYKRRKRWLT